MKRKHGWRECRTAKFPSSGKRCNMVSYWKTQWWRIILALVSLVAALFYMFQPAADSSTIEGLNETMSDIVNAGVYFTGFIIWTFLSVIEYNNDRIELLEKKAEKYDALEQKFDAMLEYIETLELACGYKSLGSNFREGKND